MHYYLFLIMTYQCLILTKSGAKLPKFLNMLKDEIDN